MRLRPYYTTNPSRAINHPERHWGSHSRACPELCESRNWPFFIAQASDIRSRRTRHLKSILGKLRIPEKQVLVFAVKNRMQLSPSLEKCCLLLSANASCERSAQDISVLIGLSVSRGSQHRLVHRQPFAFPVVETAVEKWSTDGERSTSAHQRGNGAVGRTLKR